MSIEGQEETGIEDSGITEEENKAVEEYGEGFEEAAKDLDKEESEQGLPAETDKTEPTPKAEDKPEPEPTPEPNKDQAPVSEKHGTVESMEKAVAETRSWALTQKNEADAKNKALEERIKDLEAGSATQADVDKAKAEQAAAEKSAQNAVDDFDKVAADAMEDYPELKPVIEGLLRKQKESDAKQTATEEELKKLQEKEKADAKKSADQKIIDNYEKNIKPVIIKAHPDFDEHMDEGFFTWAKMQTPALRFAATQSGDPQDMINAMSEYKKHLATPAAKEAAEKEKADKDKRMNLSQSMRGGTSPIPKDTKPDEGDYSSGFDEEAAAIAREESGP